MNAVISILIRIIEGMFVVGMLGSCVVWVLTAFELAKVVGPDDTEAANGQPASE